MSKIINNNGLPAKHYNESEETINNNTIFFSKDKTNENCRVSSLNNKIFDLPSNNNLKNNSFSKEEDLKKQNKVNTNDIYRLTNSDKNHRLNLVQAILCKV